MTATAPTFEPQRVFDGDQEIQFDGVLLGRASSRTAERPRWMEVCIYRTKGGQYVVTKIGRSLVFHTRNCRSETSELRTLNDLEPTDIPFPCYKCRPSAFDESVVVERDKHWSQVSATPEGAIEGLYQVDDDNVMYLPQVTRRALERAMAVDNKLKSAFTVRRVS